MAFFKLDAFFNYNSCFITLRGRTTLCGTHVAVNARGHFAQGLLSSSWAIQPPPTSSPPVQAEHLGRMESPVGFASAWGPFNTAPAGTRSVQSPCVARADCNTAASAASNAEVQLPRGAGSLQIRGSARPREPRGADGQEGRRQWLPQATGVAAEAAKTQYIQQLKNCGVTPRCSNAPLCWVPHTDDAITSRLFCIQTNVWPYSKALRG